MSMPCPLTCRLGGSCVDGYLARGLGTGVEALQVRLTNRSFAPHAHDTYTVVATTAGVQEFRYRGGVHRSLPGQVVVLHPGETHDGRAGGGGSFAYTGLHVSAAAARAHLPGLAAGAALPFVDTPVLDHAHLRMLLLGTFLHPHEEQEELAAFELVTEVMQTVWALAGSTFLPGRGRHSRRIEYAEQYLREHATRSIRLKELAEACSLSTSEICRQFKHRYGISPYRYVLLRRVEMARHRIGRGMPLAQVAVAVGFSDQPQMTRAFRAAFGLTPGTYAALQQRAAPPREQGSLYPTAKDGILL